MTFTEAAVWLVNGHVRPDDGRRYVLDPSWPLPRWRPHLDPAWGLDRFGALVSSFILGAPVPPVILGSVAPLDVYDGVHRISAARAAGLTVLPAYVLASLP